MDRSGRFSALTQQEPLDLPGRSLGQDPEDDLSRRLEASEVRAAVLDDFFGGRVCPVLQLDESARDLTPLLVGRRHDSGGEHRWMAVEDVLDFYRRDVLAARDDDVLRPVLDLYVPVRL